VFPRSYNSFNSGPKSPLDGAWHKSTKLNVSVLGTTKSPKLQNPSSSFAIPEVLLEIPNVIYVDFDEVLFEIPNFTVVDLDEIMELLNS
jgi:hypothetical protein